MIIGAQGHGRAAADYLALGDSYTIGEGVDPDHRWPTLLAAELRARGVAVMRPHFIATNGWTTDELSQAIDEAVAQGQVQPPYELVGLQIGVNDQYRGRDVDSYRQGFASLLERAIGFAGNDPARTLVVSIPDWGVTPFARAAGRNAAQVAAEIDAFNAAARQLCDERGVLFADITDISRRPELGDAVVADGLHPSAQMYRLWAERIQAVMTV